VAARSLASNASRRLLRQASFFLSIPLCIIVHIKIEGNVFVLTIAEYTVEEIKDPFGIIEGDRYEFILYINVPEDDELFNEKGIYIKVLFGVKGDESKLIKYDLYEAESNQYLDFDLEEDEEKEVFEFCKTHLTVEE
jgi:hypothetical protein